jgi:hypothetical protein
VIATLTPPDESLTSQPARGIDGDLAIVGATGMVVDFPSDFIPGAAYICERDTNGTWNEITRPAPTGVPAAVAATAAFFGEQVAISRTAALARETSHRGLFRREQDLWQLVRRFGNGSIRGNYS